MKKLKLIVLFTAVQIAIFGQTRKELFENPEMPLHQILSGSHLKSANEYYATRPDSIILYSDSLETEVRRKEKFLYEGNKVTYTYQQLKTYANRLREPYKIEYYIDESMPDIMYTPYVKGTGLIINNVLAYKEQASVGDSMAVYYSWDSVKMDWQKMFKFNHTVNNKGVNESTVSYKWDTSNNQWIYNCRSEMTVSHNSPDSVKYALIFPDSSGHEPDVRNYVFWMNENNQIKRREQIHSRFTSVDSLVYDHKNRLIEKYRWWDIFADTSSDRYTYDEYNRISHIDYLRKEEGEQNYSLRFRGIYYYSSIPINGLSRIKRKGEVILYPNPANNYFRVKDYEGRIRITNATGQEVINKSVPTDTPVEINFLQKGFYILHLEDGRTKSFVKY